MPTYKCQVEYDGTDFCGWQRQQEFRSIQQTMEEAINAFCGQEVHVYASGRTDAGVHALGQVVQFTIDKEFESFRVSEAINFHLKPNKIAITACEKINDPDFHVRFSATMRHYKYVIINRRAPLAIDRDRAWQVATPLDIRKMQIAAKHLEGQHDFTSFRDSKCEAKSPIKTVSRIDIKQSHDRIEIDVYAKSFLHHMVRNIAGTLKIVGEGKRDANSIPEILAAKNRCSAGPTAPAHGLYFMAISY